MSANASSQSRIARLADRGVVAVTGADAAKLLGGLITNDVDLLEQQDALHAGLLTPQGKILFEFFVAKAPAALGEGFLIETARDKAAGLAARLGLYKLRAKVDIRDASADYVVLALWGAGAEVFGPTKKTVVFADPRLAALGTRILAEAEHAADIAASASGLDASPEDYHAHRIALGVPEGGKDYALGDTFPHEALFDQLTGVSFTKGCFIGQEVVSRMQHRGTARKRVVPVVAERDLPAPGSEIKAGDVAIGTLGSVAGRRGLALLRLDRAAEAGAKGVALTAGDVPITVVLPAFATFALKPSEAPA